MSEAKDGSLLIIPVGWHRGPFRQKLGIPRQSGLHRATSEIELDGERVGPDAVRGLDGVSHLWLTFGFSKHDPSKAKDLVRPPRLGGQAQLGVFATRSPYRHNGLGLSLVELVSVEFPIVRVRGADLLDGTPIYDIKPYLPWAEAKSDARCDWAAKAPPPLRAELSDEALEQINVRDDAHELRRLLASSLVVDPRPAYDREDDGRRFRTRLGPMDVEFHIDGERLVVTDIRFDAPT
jgi:tRNA-Thr(GGU) m(6)t(6)A37 methyltransferase TsaA